MEESGTLEPQLTMQTIPVQPQTPEQPIQLFDGSRIFVHAPQFHWHAAATEGIPVVDQEARDRLVSIAVLLDGLDVKQNCEKRSYGHVQNVLQKDQRWFVWWNP